MVWTRPAPQNNPAAEETNQLAGGVLRAARQQLLALAAAAVGVLGAVQHVQARGPEQPLPAATVALVALPLEAQATYRLIHQGGPFPYQRDGTVFFNRERLLPTQPRGHYREYTVRTPGVSHRGARRIVCGGRPPSQPEACWYTADHYNSFRRIQP